MSSRHRHSSVLIEHPTSPPHLLSPERSVPYSPTLEPSRQPSPERVAEPDLEAVQSQSTMEAAREPQAVADEAVESAAPTPAPLIPFVAEDTDAEIVEGETPADTAVSSSEPHRESPESIDEGVETTGAVVPENTDPVPASNSPTSPTPEANASTETPQTIDAVATTERTSTPPPSDFLTFSDPPAIPEPEGESEPQDEPPSWVTWEEDLTTPDEEEMKEIEASEYDKLAATDVVSMESQFYSDLEDPEQRPSKKLRMNWVIKGVRGTKEKPNMARVMNSPAVCVDGLYWSIKFYPRGDNCTSLSAFVRCSRNPPKQVEEMPEHTFAFFEGLPDANFAKDYEPKVMVSAPNTQRLREEPKTKKKEKVAAEEAKKADADGEDSDDSARETAPRVPETSDRREDDDDDNNDASDDVDEKELQDWRVSAQLGMAIYNPAESRTGHLQSDGHQFSKHCDDWGWVNFVGPWDEIHKRKRGQRQPLLRDDTLAIDAYVRIYEDPTQALWWHDSKTESQWPSKQLSGYYPMGTPALYHSPAVAGITAWTVLAPFREIIQKADGGMWRKDSSYSPMPLICQTQIVLHQMRNLSSDCYVNVFKVIEELMEADEPWEDVKAFWEVFRRSLELELAGNTEALQKFSDIFDAAGKPFKMPSIPVPGEDNIASGIAKYFDEQNFKGALPNFMPVMLNRQQFDKEKREWKLHHNRVQLSDELDLSKWSTDENAKYTLYGFVTHVGTRNSGKFYSILRPNGIGSKWLAFEDGNGNKVLSYTKKRIQEYEGLEGDELKEFSSNRDNAYLAMYVRASCWNEYLLPDGLESYKLPKWLRTYSDGPYDELLAEEREAEDKEDAEDEKEQEEQGMTVELYLDEYVKNCENMLELHDVRMSPQSREYCQTVKIATDKTYRDLRQKIADAFELSDTSKIGLWEMSYRSLGKFSRAELETVADRRKIQRDVSAGQPWRMWLSVLEPSEGRQSYKDLLPKISEMGLEVKAPPEEKSEGKSNESEKEVVEPAAGSDNSTPVAERAAGEPNPLAIDTSSSNTDESNTTGIATPTTSTTGESAPDIEQASVGTAVATDLERAAIAQLQITNSAMESSEGEQSSDERAVAITIAPTTSRDSTDSPQVLPGESIVETVASIMPVEHGHLVDAAEPTNNALEPTIDHPGEGDTAQPTIELSAEDAAAIAAVLAADAEEDAAAARGPGDLPTSEQQSAGGDQIPDGEEHPSETEPNTAAHIEIELVRSSSPQPILHVYGFIHMFDAEAQKFIAQKPFNPEIEQEIGSAVRNALGYAEDKEIRIWKREGPSGTAPITSNSTFVSSNFQDGFTLIVGDVISETKLDDLKQAGKFWQPAQLIKYLITARRGHPILSKTSEEPVEITEFGGDYFKGPIVNGQPHGENCLLITSSGHTYEGALVAGLKSGAKGKMTYQNGDVYTGGWLNDERHGQGEHVEARTGNRYVGGFENGKRWGEGVTYWKVADDQAAMCQICYGEEIDALFYDCGHVCACVECAKQCENCPICRKSVRHVVKMYRS